MPGDIQPVLVHLRQFVADREWEEFHDAKNLTMLLASEVGELASALRWVKSADVAEFVNRPEVRGRLADEIGDVGIALLLLCDRLGLVLTDVIMSKLEKNRANYPVGSARGRADRA